MHPTALLHAQHTIMLRLSVKSLLYCTSMADAIEMQPYNENTIEYHVSMERKPAHEKSHSARTRRPLLLAPQISPHKVNSLSFENSRDSITFSENPLSMGREGNIMESSPRDSSLHPLENLALVARARARDSASRPTPLALSRVFDFCADPVSYDDSFAASELLDKLNPSSHFLRDDTFTFSRPVKVEHAPHMLQPLAEDTSDIADIDQWAALKHAGWSQSTNAGCGPLADVLDYALPPTSDDDILMRIWDFEMNKPQPEIKPGLFARSTGTDAYDSRYPWHQFISRTHREVGSNSRDGIDLDSCGSTVESDEVCQDLDRYFLELHSN